MKGDGRYRGQHIDTALHYAATQIDLKHTVIVGFNKLVILSESSFQNAIQIVNPGQTGIARVMAKTYLTPQVEKWPPVYATDDIIIEDIP